MAPSASCVYRISHPLPTEMAIGPESSRHIMSAASTMTGAVVGLGLLGFLLDRKFESAPYLLLAGLLVGLVVGFYDIWKVMFRPGRKS